MTTLPNIGSLIGRIETVLGRQLASPIADPKRKAIAREIRKALGKLGHDGPGEISAPTRELVRQMGREPVVQDREPNGDPLANKRHVFEWPVQSMASALSAEQYHAAERIRAAHLTRHNNPNGGDLDGAGRSAPGSRMPITDRQLQASREFNAIWYRLTPELRWIVTNFVFDEPPHGEKHVMPAEDFGRKYGSTSDKRRALGVATGAVRATLAQVVGLFRDYDQWRASQRTGEVTRVGPRRARITDEERKMLMTWTK